MRKRELHAEHHGREESGGEEEAEPGSPQRIELTVADSDADCIPAGEDCSRDERRERDLVAIEHHRSTLRGGSPSGSTRQSVP
jgi:hypothetical protein